MRITLSRVLYDRIMAARGIGEVVAPFTPLSLFSSSETGAWYDPSDLSTLWQDTEGTVPVTTDGQTVARMDDKSGNGNHLTQATSLARPAYKTDGTCHWLLGNGSGTGLSRSGTELALLGNMSSYAAINRTTATTGFFMIHTIMTSSGSLNVPYEHRMSNAEPAGQTFSAGDTASIAAVTSSSTVAINSAPVIVGAERTVGASVRFYNNGTFLAAQAHTKVPTTTGTPVFMIMNRNVSAAAANGQYYGGLILNRLLTDTERGNLATWLASKAGTTL